MLQFDDIALLRCHQICNLCKLSWLIRQQYRYGKYAVSLDQTMLYDGCNCDHIHVAAAQDGYDFFLLHIQVFQSSHSQKTGVLNDHLVVFYHIKECHDQLGVLDGDDIIHIDLDVREQQIARVFNGSTIRDCVDAWKSHYLSCFQGFLHTVCACRFYTDHFDLRIQQFCQRCNTGTESAAANRNQNIINSRKLFDDLHGDGSLTGGYVQIVEGMKVYPCSAASSFAYASASSNTSP